MNMHIEKYSIEQWIDEWEKFMSWMEHPTVHMNSLDLNTFISVPVWLVHLHDMRSFNVKGDYSAGEAIVVLVRTNFIENNGKIVRHDEFTHRPYVKDLKNHIIAYPKFDAWIQTGLVVSTGLSLTDISPLVKIAKKYIGRIAFAFAEKFQPDNLMNLDFYTFAMPYRPRGCDVNQFIGKSISYEVAHDEESPTLLSWSNEKIRAQFFSRKFDLGFSVDFIDWEAPRLLEWKDSPVLNKFEVYRTF